MKQNLKLILKTLLVLIYQLQVEFFLYINILFLYKNIFFFNILNKVGCNFLKFKLNLVKKLN